ncbi:ABC transporter ATP-binding protein [Liquorilactobacillus mali]|uniref:Multidrug ABC transporter ATPase permease n=2 Tax=Liquorilactobacillus mali TaxID=1618 RepID=J0UQ77_9LACO|nr:multidrug ABC transporter ATPase/permease [Liquorilactobacillus mali KCTC 3596 = DSM 20444]KRN09172.1 multidrug ABC transporter ATPase permease [Liquorilactobacillus mali KCTC 3596 = DSM 20444]MDV7757356.1 ATP-binding cassette domain-containing protein [Liquorilactobacillus mali]QFQ73672.1 ABC transporter ATP-binding protein [Liquorilactobacillus mali]
MQMNHHRPGRNLHPEKVSLNNWKQTVKRILNYLAFARGKLILVFFLTIFTTMATIVGNRVNGIVVDQFLSANKMHTLFVICGLMAVMYIVASICTYFQNAIIIKVAQRASAAIRHDIFAQLQRLPLRYFDTHDKGDVMSRLTNDVDNINTAMMQTFVQLFTGIISVVGMGVAMLLLSPLLTLIVLLSSIMTYIFTRIVAKITQKAFVTQQDALGALNTQIEESVSGKQVIQLFDHEAQTMGTFNKTNERYTKAAFRAQAFSSMIGPINNGTNNVAYLVITAAGAFSILTHSSTITVGTIFTFLIYLRNFTGPINNILDLLNTLQLSLASAERVFEVIDEKPEKDIKHALAMTHTKGNVAFEHVDFAYGLQQILHDVNISAKQGQVIALVGPTGAGKTTIMNLLTNLYPLSKGRVLLDKHDVTSIKRSNLRRLVTVVQQEPFMFSLSIKENIRLGRMNATDEDVRLAAKRANADNFIMQLRDGYDTILSENAHNISQGQRQLLSIARAFIAEAPVLVLDEATASIDSNTESDVQKAMTDLMQDKTSFVIAHRLSTIRNADQICVIDAGRVVECGTHDELLQKNGAYARLYNSQFS